MLNLIGAGIKIIGFFSLSLALATWIEWDGETLAIHAQNTSDQIAASSWAKSLKKSLSEITQNTDRYVREARESSRELKDEVRTHSSAAARRSGRKNDSNAASTASAQHEEISSEEKKQLRTLIQELRSEESSQRR